MLLVEKICASLGVVAAAAGVIAFVSMAATSQEARDPFPHSVTAPEE